MRSTVNPTYPTSRMNAMKTMNLTIYIQRLARAASLMIVAVMILGRLSAGAQSNPISKSALDEISALLSEKASWTPVQAKMDSELIHAVKNHRGQVFAAGAPNLQLDVD